MECSQLVIFAGGPSGRREDTRLRQSASRWLNSSRATGQSSPVVQQLRHYHRYLGPHPTKSTDSHYVGNIPDSHNSAKEGSSQAGDRSARGQTGRKHQKRSAPWVLAPLQQPAGSTPQAPSHSRECMCPHAPPYPAAPWTEQSTNGIMF